MPNLGNAWHIPRSTEVEGYDGMCDPAGEVAHGTPLHIISGNQSRGLGRPGNQLQSVSVVHYRDASGAWGSTSLQFLHEVDGNQYFRAELPTGTYRSGSPIKYFLQIEYSDRDTTFAYRNGDASACTDDRTTAESSPFEVTVIKGLSGRLRGIFFLLFGLITGGIAVWDTFTADRVYGQAAAFFTAIAAASAAWAGCLLYRRTPSRWSGIGGAIAVLAISIVYANSAWSDYWWTQPRPTVAVLLAMLTALSAVAAAVISWLQDRTDLPTRPKRRSTLRLEVALAVTALIGTLLAAGLQVSGSWYTTTHNPTQLHPNITLQISIESPVELNDATVAVPVEVALKNTGQSGVDLPMTHYTAVGFKVGDASVNEAGPLATFSGYGDFSFTRFRSTFAAPGCGTILQFGRVVELMSNLGPGEEKTRRLLVPLPPDGRKLFDGIRIMAELAATQDDELRTVTDTPALFRIDAASGIAKSVPRSADLRRARGLYAAWEIERSTLLTTLVAAKREIRVGWDVQLTESPSPSCVQPVSSTHSQMVRPYVRFVYAHQSGAGAVKEDLADRYDPFYVRAVSERLLCEEEEQPPGQ